MVRSTLSSRRRRAVRIAVLASLLVAGRGAARAQQPAPCPAVTVPPPSSDNLLNEEQERELGQVTKNQFQIAARVIEEPALTGYMRAVGARLQAALALSPVTFEFALADVGEANAYSLPGGWIYVSRKLVGMLRSEDELAGVLAHEMGHALTHDVARDFSRGLRKVLRVERVETQEVFERFHELHESDKWEAGRTTDDEQDTADHLALRLLRAAGYRPATMADWFDRLAGLKGRTGSSFSDFLGSTPPHAKRLRALTQQVNAAPPCTAAAAAPLPRTFEQWQAAVLHYNGIGHSESLPGLVGRRKLVPSLRPEIEALRFSPDGRYLLAQDESAIWVFEREGLRPLFQIPAENARRAVFSPDSQRVSFFAIPLFGSPRVEAWSIAERSSSVREIHVAGGCYQAALSPSGDTLVCLTQGENFNGQLTLDLRLIAVASGASVLERRPFVTISARDYLERGLDAVNVGFTPDGRYLLLGSEEVAEGYDLISARAIELKPSVKRLIRSRFVFADARRIVGRVGPETRMVSFPDGAILRESLKAGATGFGSVAEGDYLVLSSVKGTTVGVLDLKTNGIVLARPGRAADVFQGVCVSEREDGKLALHRLADGKEIDTASVPDSPLVSPRSVAVSPDRRWLAVSTGTRSAVWNLETGERALHLKDFESSSIGEAQTLQAVFKDGAPPVRTLVSIDLPARAVTSKKEGERDVRWSHVGRFIFTVRSEKADGRRPGDGVTLEVRDASSDALLWRRALAFDPATKHLNAATGLLLLGWSLADDAPNKAVRADAAWAEALRGVDDRHRTACFEILDAATGAVRGRVAVNMVASAVGYVGTASADRLFLHESRGRLVAYSFDGKVQGRALGWSVSVSSDGRRVALGTGPGRMAILDAAGLAPLSELCFPSEVAAARFPAGSDTLVVLTSGQEVHTFDLRSPGTATR